MDNAILDLVDEFLNNDISTDILNLLKSAVS
jgi:hypothetical protein